MIPEDDDEVIRSLEQIAERAAGVSTFTEVPERIRRAARRAREDFKAARVALGLENDAHIETLWLMAASGADGSDRLPDMTTAQGFKVSFSYEAAGGTSESSVAILVHSPPGQVASVQGMTAFLWHGSSRFKLGQFDQEGKAFGVLPMGVEIAIADCAAGDVKVETRRTR